jgi:hypothetical protein
MTDTCGPTSQPPFAWYDPDGRCWRTSQGTFLSDTSLSSVTWPKQGSTRGGLAYEHPTLALRTAANGSSSLLTTPMVGYTGTGPEEYLARKVAPGGGATINDLALAVRMLPTPTGSDAMGGRNSTARRRPDSTGHPGDTLTDAVWKVARPDLEEAGMLLPTPRTSDTNGAGPHGDGGPDLRTAVGALTNRRSDDGNTPSVDAPPLQWTTEDD